MPSSYSRRYGLWGSLEFRTRQQNQYEAQQSRPPKQTCRVVQFLLIQEGSTVRRIPGQFLGWAVLLLAESRAHTQLPACNAGFEISKTCIAERGLDQKVGEYERKITEAMPRLGASYKISLRPVNHPVEAGYNAATIGDVFTEVVRNDQMRNQSFYHKRDCRFSGEPTRTAV